MIRLPIAEPARYYDSRRSIVLRSGLLLAEERRYLWHELVHADRGDRACHGSIESEISVEREAARRAMPMSSLLWALGLEWERHLVAGLLKLPEEWVQFRFDHAHPTEQHRLRAVHYARRHGETYEEESA